jgi:hypothetical protein
MVTVCVWLSRPNIPPTRLGRGRRSEIKVALASLKLLLIGRIPSDPYTRLKGGCFRTGMACCPQSWWVPQLEPAYGIRLRQRWCLEGLLLDGRPVMAVGSPSRRSESHFGAWLHGLALGIGAGRACKCNQSYHCICSWTLPQ